MSRFALRYKVGQAPADADEDDVVIVEAATFATTGNFVDFFERSSQTVGGQVHGTGGIVYRVQESLVAEIRRLE